MAVGMIEVPTTELDFDQLPPEKQTIVQPAVQRVVRTAYMLDAFGDLGNKQQILEAYAIFTAAVKEIQAAFPEKK